MDVPNFKQSGSGLASISDRREWCRRESQYMADQGATFFRVTHKPDDDSELILEGWYKQPHRDDMPDPPWGEPFTSHHLNERFGST